jgi:hypothetical protein
MIAFKSSRNDPSVSRADALNATPVKNIDITETHLESGDVRIEYPARMRPLLAAVVGYFGGRTDRTYVKKLQLDGLGTQVWQMIDDRRTVKQIIHRFADAHRLHSREAEVSVTAFLRELGKRGIIGLR